MFLELIKFQKIYHNAEMEIDKAYLDTFLSSVFIFSTSVIDALAPPPQAPPASSLILINQMICLWQTAAIGRNRVTASL